MLVEIFKRNVSVLIPGVLVFGAIQYHETGVVAASGIAAYVIVFLLASMAFERFDAGWRRRFGTGKGSVIVRIALWSVVAVCMYLFFRHLDRA